MGVFDRRRKPDADTELGVGAWRRVHDRFDRAVTRYVTTVAGVEQRTVRAQLAEFGEQLQVCLVLVQRTCARAQRAAPSAGPDVPARDGGHWLDVHRRLSKAATLCAQACEGAMTARVAARAHADEDLQVTLDSVQRAVKQVAELIDEAQDLPASARGH